MTGIFVLAVASLAVFVAPMATSSAQTGAVQAPPTGIIAGRVVDAAGAPVGSAIVFIREGPVPSIPSRFGPGQDSKDRVLADESGRFVFSNLAAGKYAIDTTKPGWLPGAFGRKRPGGNAGSIDLAAAERRNDLTITLWRPAVIAGHMTDDNGDPLVGIEVRAIRQIFIAGRRQSDTPIREKTDDRGAFRFSSLVPGDYVVAALASVLSEPPGFASAIRAEGGRTPRAYYQTMTALGTAPIVFDRAPGVVGADRALVGSLAPLPGIPAADGAWPSYPTTFHPSAATLRSATVVRVSSGTVRSDVDVSARITTTWQVSGVLRDAGGPAAWNAVHLVPADSGETPLVDVSTAVTDAKGAFTFYGVPPGQYIARVVRVQWPTNPDEGMGLAGGTGAIPHVITFGGPRSSGASPPPTEPLLHVSESVTVTNRHTRDLALTMREGPRVRGRARFEGSKPQPAPDQLRGVTVSVAAANGRVDHATWPGQFSGDGQFTIPSLWPGRYLIHADAPPGWTFKDATYQGRDISDLPIDITGDLDNVIITFTDQVRTMTGTVRVDAGQDVDGSMVLLFPADPAGWVDYGRASRRVTSTRVGRAGEFSIALPPAGEYCLIAIPDELVDEWQNPETLTKLASLADRVRVGNVSITQSLQVKRIR